VLISSKTCPHVSMSSEIDFGEAGGMVIKECRVSCLGNGTGTVVHCLLLVVVDFWGCI
jgi:hypothetical protein